MTNDEGNPKSKIRRTGATDNEFGFRASASFRHSTFGIRHSKRDMMIEEPCGSSRGPVQFDSFGNGPIRERVVRAVSPSPSPFRLRGAPKHRSGATAAGRGNSAHRAVNAE